MARKRIEGTLAAVVKVIVVIVAILIALSLLRFGLQVLVDLLPILLFLSWVVPPIWVARDARRRGADHPLLWAVFVLLTWIVGLVIYLMLRPQHPLLFHCDSCGNEVKNEYVACPHCGADLRPRITRCPSCKRLIDRDWSFCPYCKTELPS